MDNKGLYSIFSDDFIDIVTKLSKKADAQLEDAAYKVGVILQTLKMLDMDGASKNQARMQLPSSEIDYLDMINDEYSGATLYWHIYQQVGDDMYRQMAKQELGHFVALRDKAIATGAIKDQVALSDIQAKYAEMVSLIK